MPLTLKHHTSKHPRFFPFNPSLIAQAVGLALLGTPLWATAQTAAAAQTLPRVEVTGTTAAPPLTRITEDIAASPANVTVLGRKELDQKSITTYGDIFRGVTGVYVAEYGQGLVAYELKFRGFNSGHGRDVAGFLDGVPLNITGSQHTNGYMDLAQLIPELVDRVEIVQGPFSAYAGNHAVAGSVQFYTDRNVPTMLKASVDSFGRTRILPVLSTDIGPGTLLLAADATKGSSYTRQSDVSRLNLFSRYSFPMLNGYGAIRFQAYKADAEAPGYLDLAKIESGTIDRRDALAKGIGDAKRQQNLVFNYRSDDPEGRSGFGSGWTSSLYAVRDKRERFTFYDLSVPPNSSVPLGAERDRLQQSGFDLRKTSMFEAAGMPAQWTAGLQYNSERIAALNYLADADHRALAPSVATPDTLGIDRTVLTTTQSAYVQVQVKPIEALKLTGGLRYDNIGFKVNLRPQDDTYADAAATGLIDVNTKAARFSPKLGAALRLADSSESSVDLFANYATGLKSPYAFSDFFSNVAASSAVPDLTPSTLRSFELGLAGGAKDNSSRWRAGFWDTRQEKEGQRDDAGIFRSFGTTLRRGFDVEGSALVTSTLRLYANYSALRARSLTASPGQDYLTNVPEWVGTVGANSVFASGVHRFDFTLENSMVGPASVTADNSIRTRSFNRLTARAGYGNAAYKGLTGFVQLVGYDRPLEETQFDFGGGVKGISPRPKLSTLLGLQYTFNL